MRVGPRSENAGVLFSEVAATWRAVGATSARKQKTGLLADCLRRAPAAEVPVVVTYLAGELRQRRTGVGWAAFRDAPAPAEASSLTVADVDETFERAAGL